MADASLTSASSKCTTKTRLACTAATGGTEGEEPAARIIEIVLAMGVDGDEQQPEGNAITGYR